MSTFDDAQDRIVQGAEWLHRAVSDVEGRYRRAVDAGAELAAAVYRHTQEPNGEDAVEAAYQKFMALHSANFAEPMPKRRSSYS